MSSVGSDVGTERQQKSFFLSYHSRLAAIPTRLTMDVADVDATVEGARAGAMLLPQLQDYLADRGGKGSRDTSR